MMRNTERKLEKKRKKKGGSNGENLEEREKKRNCPFDAKKVCPVTFQFQLNRENAEDFIKAFRPNQRLHSFDDITVEVWI